MIKSAHHVIGVCKLGGHVVAVGIIYIAVADTVLFKVRLGDVLHVGYKQVGVLLPVLVILKCLFLSKWDADLHIGRAVEHVLAYLDIVGSEFLHLS